MNVHRRQIWIMGVGPCTKTTSCYEHLSCLACLSISGYTADVVGGLLDFKDVCRATTIVALIIAIAVPTCIRARYRLISVRCDIVSKPSLTATKNPRIRIRTNCREVRRFGCELRICNNTSYNALTGWTPNSNYDNLTFSCLLIAAGS